jgi:hypothetical protein
LPPQGPSCILLIRLRAKSWDFDLFDGSRAYSVG